MTITVKIIRKALLLPIVTVLLAHPAWAADIHMIGGASVTGSVTAASFSGSGVGLTGIPAAAVTNLLVTTGQLADNTVAASKLSDISATPAKMAFYHRVAIVAKVGGDYDNPATAMTNYVAWCPSPSSSNPCLLKIMPGFYNVTASVQMQPFVDMEGSGENTTIIRGNIASSSAGTVNGASNAEIRFLGVRNTGGGTNAYAFYNRSSSPKMTNVTASASGGTSHSIAVYNTSSSPVMTNVTATASANSGPTSYSRGVYNNSSSPVMTNVTATASGGTSANYGVYNSSSSPVMTNVTATASGNTLNYGVYNSSSSPVMSNMTATASDGTGNYGIYNVSSSPEMTYVSVTVSGASALNCAIYNSSSGKVTINRSVIRSPATTLHNGAGVTTLVGRSHLDGRYLDNSGTISCVGSYDQNFFALSTSCY
jgi:hypothetical protein